MLYRGDDTNAFNNKFITIELENAEGLIISKAEFKCGEILKTFENPVFPIEISLSSEETSRLFQNNSCYLAIYDELGRKHTCNGYLSFSSKREVV